MNKLRILLGDDHLLLRHGLRRILQERPDWEVVGEASDGRDAVAQALETRPDIAIFDIGMPLLNGVDATAQLVRRLHDLRVLILSLHATEGDIVKALKAGAKGYLSKEVADVELIRAVEALRDGKSYFSPAASKVILDDYVKHLGEQNVTDRYASLSEREREIFQLVAEGHSNKEIADRLLVGVRTIETHREHIMRKLNIHTVAGLTKFTIVKGMITLD